MLGATAEGEEAGLGLLLDVDPTTVLRGRVLSVHGLISTVEAEDGTITMCATRRLLKTLSTDQRHVVAAGDFVMFRPAAGHEGIIERVEPRTSVLSRATRGRQQIIVTNVDQLLIIASAAEPYLKPNLIDRFLISAHKTGLRPLDLHQQDRPGRSGLARAPGRRVQPDGLPRAAAVGRDRFGHRSPAPRDGRPRQRRGRSERRRQIVAAQCGRSQAATCASRPSAPKRRKAATRPPPPGCCRFRRGGYVVDTPGIRQFQLWDVIAEEVGGYFRDLRPYVNHCRFPNCTHTHETDCAVKDAVADGRLDLRRYESYCHLFAGEME